MAYTTIYQYQILLLVYDKCKTSYEPMFSNFRSRCTQRGTLDMHFGRIRDFDLADGSRKLHSISALISFRHQFHPDANSELLRFQLQVIFDSYSSRCPLLWAAKAMLIRGICDNQFRLSSRNRKLIRHDNVANHQKRGYYFGRSSDRSK